MRQDLTCSVTARPFSSPPRTPSFIIAPQGGLSSRTLSLLIPPTVASVDDNRDTSGSESTYWEGCWCDRGLGAPASVLKLLLMRIADEAALERHFQKAPEWDGFILVPILAPE